MKKILLYLFLLIGTNSFSIISFAKKVPQEDSIVSTPPVYTPPQSDFNPNIESLVRYQEERRAKQKKAAMIRIGIGVAFLVVLVIGLRRKGKK